MVRRADAGDRRGWLARRFLLASLLALALLFGHQLVMATARHAGDMAMGGGLAMPAGATMRAVAAPAHDPPDLTIPGDRRPLSGWEACFAQYGVLPTLLLLLLLAGIGGRVAGATLADMFPGGAPLARFLHPPPLEPSRRRALLQVFLN